MSLDEDAKHRLGAQRERDRVRARQQIDIVVALQMHAIVVAEVADAVERRRQQRRLKTQKQSLRFVKTIQREQRNSIEISFKFETKLDNADRETRRRQMASNPEIHSSLTNKKK